MTTDTSVKTFTSTDAGASTLSGTAGALLSVLDACLITGYNLKAASSLTASASVATLTANGHGFKVGQVVLVAGASDPLHNGEKKITYVDFNTIKYAVDPAAAAAPTGAITVKMAPLGWAKPFSGTNLAAYTSSSPQSLGMLLRVDDTGTNNARVVGYESMTDINTGSGPFPASAQVSGGAYWPKSSVANSTSRAWFLIGDGRIFYYCSYPNLSYPTTGGVLFPFGDIIAASSVDSYAAILGGGTADRTGANTQVSECASVAHNTASSAAVYFSREYTQFPGAKVAWRTGAMAWSNAQYSGATNYSASTLPFPNPADNGLIMCPVFVGTSGLRGTLPGYYHTPQAAAGSFNLYDAVPGADALAGKLMLAAITGAPASANSYLGASFFDTTGPWR
ncbi:hypothetical protein AWV79_28235 [Cupriavidus sp. UYMMa02A]|nr:hypothetical protein AWV79_28235 [Cupriavidus sp. UYMMa02A]